MNEEKNRHISDEQLTAYVDGDLAAGLETAELVAAHLAECDECRVALDELRAGVQAMAELPVVAAPDAIWTRIERSLPAPELRKRYERFRYYIAAAAVAAAAVISFFFFVPPRRDEPTGWEVTRLGTVAQPLRRGEWIEHTPATKGEVSVKAGSIGSILIAPDTRIRLIEATAKEQRMALAYGRIQVRISAPPRLFQVETQAGTAVDPGFD